MMSKKQFIESQKECASMLGVTVDQYENSLKNIKVPKFEKKDKKKNDDSMLSRFGLSAGDLKKKRVY